MVGVWDVTAPKAPFPHHVFAFLFDGIVLQSNPPAGNRSTSDSAAFGVWEFDGDVVQARLLEHHADPDTGVPCGSTQLTLRFTVFGNDLHGEAITTSTSGAVATTSIFGTRVSISPHRERLSAAGHRAVTDPLADLFGEIATRASAFEQRTGKAFLSLAAGTPDTSLLPAEIYESITHRILHVVGAQSLNYTLPQGTVAARTAIATYLETFSITATADDLLITNGGIEALSLATLLMLDPGDVVVTEKPGFPTLLSLFEVVGAQVVQVDDLSADGLERAISTYQPKLVSLIPDFQNPTGSALSAAERQRIAEVLRRHDVIALEDATYAPLTFDGAPRHALQSFAPDNVIYAMSASKILSPAMRIGALVAPQWLLQKAIALKSIFNMQASAIHEAVVADFLSYNALTHIERLCETYAWRKNTMVEALRQEFSSELRVSWTDPDGGMFLWLTAPETVNFTKLLPAALENGVAYVPGSYFYSRHTEVPENGARLNFASMPDDLIPEAVGRLADVIKAELP